MSEARTDVDYTALSSLGSHLGALKGEFDAGDSAIAPLLGTISDSGLRSALKSFTDNWSDTRRKLANNLAQASSFAVAAGAAYQEVDDSDARTFSGNGPEPGP